jgi:hypothetical protein
MSDSKRSILLHPKRVLLLASVLVSILIVVGAYAYYAGLETKAGPRVSVLSPPLEFWIQLDKTTFLQGENVSMLVGLKNTGNETIDIMWGSYNVENGQCMYFDFSVIDENNTVVYAWYRMHGRAGAVKHKTLMPGEQLIVIYPWFTSDLNDVLVPKGNYFMKALTRPIRLTVGNSSTSIALETPTISIEVS